MRKKLVQRLLRNGPQTHVKVVKTVDGGQHLINGGIGTLRFLGGNREQCGSWATQPTNEAGQTHELRNEMVEELNVS
jgi:hypothetical protein